MKRQSEMSDSEFLISMKSNRNIAITGAAIIAGIILIVGLLLMWAHSYFYGPKDPEPQQAPIEQPKKEQDNIPDDIFKFEF